MSKSSAKTLISVRSHAERPADRSCIASIRASSRWLPRVPGTTSAPRANHTVLSAPPRDAICSADDPLPVHVEGHADHATS
eukprot:7163446-Heterocapsa_arctica.AAC.1